MIDIAYESLVNDICIESAYTMKRYGPFPMLSPRWYKDLHIMLSSGAGIKDRAKLFKAHKYPELMKMIDKCKTSEDMHMVRMELSVGHNEIKTIAERIEKVEKLGNCDETSRYYKSIYNQYISKGVTSKDVWAYYKWIKEDLHDYMNAKAKEIREAEAAKKK